MSAGGTLAQSHGDEVGFTTLRLGSEALTFQGPREGCPAGVEGICGPSGVTLATPTLEEWWSPTPSGLRQGWVLSTPNGEDVSLMLSIGPGGLESVDSDGLGATLRGSNGGLWRYEGLRAWDSAGEAVVVRMEAVEEHLVIRVTEHLSPRRWPIVIDPILTSVHDVKLMASDGTGEGYGGWHDSLGDVDGDGYNELAVGGQEAAYVYYGSASGVVSATEQKVEPSDGTGDESFGQVASAGDINADGHADLAVGALWSSRTAEHGGAVYVYLGAASGIDPASEQTWSSSDCVAYDSFGYEVAGVGDTNGDGYADLLIGAPRADSRAGAAYAYYGTASGLNIASEQKLTASDRSASSWFGATLSGGGDMDGDGFAEAVAGAPYDSSLELYAGAVYVYYGSVSGLDVTREQKVTASDAARLDGLGGSIAANADFDADGYADLAVGAIGDSDGGGYATGSVYLFTGSVSGLDIASEAQVRSSDGSTEDRFARVATGDFDGDGFSDIVVGAYGDGDIGPESGSAYVYFGSASSIDVASEVKLTASDGTRGDWFGYSVGAGDFDGDGAAEATVGAYGDDNNTGSVYVFDGTCQDLDDDSFCQPYDCDDDDATVNPRATEVCDGVDNDCDGTADESDASDASTWYLDTDGDGYGDGSAPVAACDQPSDFVDNDADCDDADGTVNPAATEVCDAIDNDCDGVVDESDASDASTWYPDADGDSYGDPTGKLSACQPPSGHVSNAKDCDDQSAAVYPGADDIPEDGVDQDCDGQDATSSNADPKSCDGCGTGGDPRSKTVLLLLLGLLASRRPIARPGQPTQASK